MTFWLNLRYQHYTRTSVVGPVLSWFSVDSLKSSCFTIAWCRPRDTFHSIRTTAERMPKSPVLSLSHNRVFVTTSGHWNENKDTFLLAACLFVCDEYTKNVTYKTSEATTVTHTFAYWGLSASLVKFLYCSNICSLICKFWNYGSAALFPSFPKYVHYNISFTQYYRYIHFIYGEFWQDLNLTPSTLRDEISLFLYTVSSLQTGAETCQQMWFHLRWNH